jgi:3-oxoacyl-[acyl-carrier protein] reductase
MRLGLAVYGTTFGMGIDPASKRLTITPKQHLDQVRDSDMHMRERRSGKIINVGSIAGHIPTQTGIIYAAAKTAITHYTRCLAEELRPFGVNVNCIAPSPTFTGRFLATRTIDSQHGLSQLQQVTKPEDIAQILLFLASSQSDALTGETIVCWM